MESVDSYIDTCPADVQPVLADVRRSILAELPAGAVECIRWGMPTYKLDGTNVVHFAAAKAHIGLYPSPDAITEFAEQLAGFKTSKGAIQFPLVEPVPLVLIAEITRWRVGVIRPGGPADSS